MLAKALSNFFYLNIFHLKAFPKGPIQKPDINKMKVPSSGSFPTTS